MSPKSERPSLAGLPLKKKTPMSLVDAEVEMTAQPAVADAPKTDDKVPVMVRMSRMDRKVLRQIALGMDTTVQALVEDAMQDIIRRHRGAMNL